MAISPLRRLRRRAYQTFFDQKSYSSETKAELVDAFHSLYYGAGVASGDTWKDTYWLGTPIRKCPLDLWVYQEILFSLKPDVILETGTGRGASAHFLASVCDILKQGEIVTVDNNERDDRPPHPRVTHLTGPSVAPEICTEMENAVARQPGAPKVMVILDSNHSRDHVIEELRFYHRLVTPGSYLIVEDSNVNGNPVERGFGPGPMEAVQGFLQENDDFFVDDEKEKFLLTFNPSGYLKRKG